MNNVGSTSPLSVRAASNTALIAYPTLLRVLADHFEL